MKTILLIRHGMTEGNSEKRYIGRTEEPLCNEGMARLHSLSPPLCDVVFSSPMIRCRQTVDILFPNQAVHVLQDLRECDFGEFEGKTAGELAGNPAYAAWLDSLCKTPIPGGEEVTAFQNRCCQAFARAAFNLPKGHTAAFVTHGGCIMAILERFAYPKRGFYDYHIGNGEYIICACEKEALTVTGGSVC